MPTTSTEKKKNLDANAGTEGEWERGRWLRGEAQPAAGRAAEGTRRADGEAAGPLVLVMVEAPFRIGMALGRLLFGRGEWRPDVGAQFFADYRAAAFLPQEADKAAVKTRLCREGLAQVSDGSAATGGVAGLFGRGQGGEVGAKGVHRLILPNGIRARNTVWSFTLR